MEPSDFARLLQQYDVLATQLVKLTTAVEELGAAAAGISAPVAQRVGWTQSAEAFEDVLRRGYRLDQFEAVRARVVRELRRPWDDA